MAAKKRDSCKKKKKKGCRSRKSRSSSKSSKKAVGMSQIFRPVINISSGGGSGGSASAVGNPSHNFPQPYGGDVLLHPLYEPALNDVVQRDRVRRENGYLVSDAHARNVPHGTKAETTKPRRAKTDPYMSVNEAKPEGLSSEPAPRFVPSRRAKPASPVDMSRLKSYVAYGAENYANRYKSENPPSSGEAEADWFRSQHPREPAPMVPNDDPIPPPDADSVPHQPDPGPYIPTHTRTNLSANYNDYVDGAMTVADPQMSRLPPKKRDSYSAEDDDMIRAVSSRLAYRASVDSARAARKILKKDAKEKGALRKAIVREKEKIQRQYEFHTPGMGIPRVRELQGEEIQDRANARAAYILNNANSPFARDFNNNEAMPLRVRQKNLKRTLAKEAVAWNTRNRTKKRILALGAEDVVARRREGEAMFAEDHRGMLHRHMDDDYTHGSRRQGIIDNRTKRATAAKGGVRSSRSAIERNPRPRAAGLNPDLLTPGTMAHRHRKENR